MHSGRLHQSIQQTARSHSALDKYPFGASAYGYWSQHKNSQNWYLDMMEVVTWQNRRWCRFKLKNLIFFSFVFLDYLVTIGRKVRGYFAGVWSSALDEIIRFSPGTNLEDGAIKVSINNILCYESEHMASDIRVLFLSLTKWQLDCHSAQLGTHWSHFHT